MNEESSDRMEPTSDLTKGGACRPVEERQTVSESVTVSKPVVHSGDGAETPLEVRPAGCPVPTTATQRRWWSYIEEHHAGAGNRLTHFAMHLVGPLNVEVLRRSLEAVVQRHESLRTRIVVDGGILLQQIDAPSAYELDVVELKGASRTGIDREMQELGKEFLAENVDLSVGPLFAARLLKRSTHEHVLVVALEHTITDLVSNGILYREIWTLYDQGTRGLPLSLPNLSLQFGDYAVWQQRTYGSWLKNHESYWRRRLASAPRVRLPLNDDFGDAQPRFHPMHIPLGSSLSQRLHDVARRERTLLALVVLTIYVIAMSRWCDQRDLIVKFLSHARYRPELQNMVGYLANSLHLRLAVTEEDSLISLLKRANLELRSAYEHQDFDRVPDLIPECTSDLVFNWVPSHGVPATDGHQSTALRIEPFLFETSWSSPYFAMFSNTSAGVVATVYSRPNHDGLCAGEQFGFVLRLFAHELLQRPLDPLKSMSMSGMRLSTPAADRRAISPTA